MYGIPPAGSILTLRGKSSTLIEFKRFKEGKRQFSKRITENDISHAVNSMYQDTTSHNNHFEFIPHPK
jgi:hypothetical protein